MSQASEVIASQYGSNINNQRTWGSVIYNVKDPQYGAKGDGSTDDKAAIQAAINAAQLTAGIVRFPPGAYNVNTGSLLITSPITIEGSGRDSSFVQTTSLTSDVFVISAPVHFKDINIRRNGAGTPTDGSAINVSTGLGSMGSIYENLQISGFYNKIEFNGGALWILQNSYIVNAYNYGVFISNSASPDTGDQVIEGCTFDEVVGGIAAIRHESGGGVKIFGNKIHSYNIGYDLQVADGAATSITIIDGNSIEKQNQYGIRLGRKGTTGSYSYLVISDNQFNVNNNSINSILITDQAVNDININDNVFNGISTLTSIKVNAGALINISGNTFSAFLTAIDLSATVNDVEVGDNKFFQVTTPIVNATSIAVGLSAADVYHRYAKTVNVTSDTVYTNVFQINMSQYNGGEFSLIVAGVVQGVGSHTRIIRKLIRRDGAACTLTNIEDVSGGGAIDVQLDTATVSGSVLIGVKRNTVGGGTRVDTQIILQLHGPGIYSVQYL